MKGLKIEKHKGQPHFKDETKITDESRYRTFTVTLKQGDMLIVTGDTLINEPVKAQVVKVSESDGTEVIIDRWRNRFFNLGMYLEAKSWVKEVKVIVS